MKYKIDNQDVEISDSCTVVTINYMSEFAPRKCDVHRFDFDVRNEAVVDALRTKDFALYWWLYRIHLDLKRMINGVQLKMF